MDPYSTVTRERALHTKVLPIVSRSIGYEDPLNITYDQSERI